VTYRVVFTPRAEREFDALDGSVRGRIAHALDRLAAAPRDSANVKALTGGGYRLRGGDWRVIYALQDDVLAVLVLRVGHRREVYR
jgi:mRNA interferase RelE/StbE